MIKTKYWALLAIAPLFVGILIGMSIQFTEAQLDDVRTQTGEEFEEKWATPSSPMATSLTVLTEDMPSYMPSLEFQDMYTFKRDARDTYAVMFSVTAGDGALENIIIQVKSDVFEHEIVISSLNAFETTEGLSRVKALDPNTITGEIVAFQLG